VEGGLRIDPSSVKGLYRRAVARHALGEWDGAVEDLGSVLKLDASNKAAAKELNSVKADQKRHHQQSSKAYKAMFSGESENL
jgi:predicted TPR repeat methyltransferase